MTIKYEYHLGSNNNGSAGLTTYNAATDNGDYYTFDGTNDGYYGTSLTDEYLFDYYAKFRIHNKSKGTEQVIWKSGGSTNGTGIGLDADGNLGIFKRESSVLYAGHLEAEYVPENVWLEMFASWREIYIIEVSTGRTIFRENYYHYGVDGTSQLSIGMGYNSDPIEGVGATYHSFFEGDIELVRIWETGDLSYDKYYMNFLLGSNQNGFDGMTQYGTVTDNGDYLTFNGSNNGIYLLEYIGREKALGIHAIFRINTKIKAAPQCILKVGGSTNGIGLGLDTSGNLGFFSVSDSGGSTSIKLSASLIPEDTWLEAIVGPNVLWLYNYETGKLIISKTGVQSLEYPIGLGTYPSIGFAYSSSPFGVTGTGCYFDGDVKQAGFIWHCGLAPSVRNIGSNFDGTCGLTVESSPVDNGDYYTFDGVNDMLWGLNSFPQDRIEIYAKFRIHNKSKGSEQVIWKCGGSSNGIAIGLDASGNLGVWGAFSYAQSWIYQDSASVVENTWLEMFASKTRLAIVNAENGVVLINTSGSVKVSAFGVASECIGGSENENPISGHTYSSMFDYFDGDIDIIKIFGEGKLAFPSSANTYDQTEVLELINHVYLKNETGYPDPLYKFPYRFVLPQYAFDKYNENAYHYCYALINNELCMTEIEQWEAGEDAIVWAKLPYVSADEDSEVKFINAENGLSGPYVIDEFYGDGIEPDTGMWTKTISVGADYLNITGNALKFIKSDTTTNTNLLYSNFYFVGDFDIEFEWQVYQLSTPSSGTNTVASLTCRKKSDDNILAGAARIRDSGANNNLYAAGSGASDYFSIDASVLTGKFRIVRTSGSISVFYWNSTLSRWEWNGNTSGFVVATGANDDAILRFDFSQSPNSTIEADVKSLIVNSANQIVGLNGVVGTDVAKSIWDENYELVYHMNSNPVAESDVILIDDFFGNDIDFDTSKWTPTIVTGGINYFRIWHNKLSYSNPAQSSAHATILDSVFTLSGDFDIEFDWGIAGMSTPTKDLSYACSVGIKRVSDSAILAEVNRNVNTSGQHYISGSGLSGNDNIAVTQYESSGIWRITRISGTLKIYYWDYTSLSWVWNGSSAGYTASTGASEVSKVYIYAEQEEDGFLYCSIDNVRLDSGTLSGFTGSTEPMKGLYSIKDSTSKENHGTANGFYLSDISETAGGRGKGLYFDGVSAEITSKNRLGMINDESRTVEIYLEPIDTTLNDLAGILGWDIIHGNSQYGLRFPADRSDGLRIYNTNYYYESKRDIFPGGIFFAWDLEERVGVSTETKDTLTFIDGVLNTNVAWLSGTFGGGDGYLRIGFAPEVSTKFFVGIIKEVRVSSIFRGASWMQAAGRNYAGTLSEGLVDTSPKYGSIVFEGRSDIGIKQLRILEANIWQRVDNIFVFKGGVWQPVKN